MIAVSQRRGTERRPRQADYAAWWINQIRDGRVVAVAPAAAATKQYNDSMKAAMPQTIWVTGCNSWYLGKDGLPELFPWIPSGTASCSGGPRSPTSTYGPPDADVGRWRHQTLRHEGEVGFCSRPRALGVDNFSSTTMIFDRYAVASDAFTNQQ